MTQTSEAWSAVGSQLEALALKVKYHGKEELAEAEERGVSLPSAFRQLGEALEAIADAARDAAKDPAVQEDLRSLGDAFTGAVTATIEEARSSLARSRSES